jgi:hypothetical protein
MHTRAIGSRRSNRCWLHRIHLCSAFLFAFALTAWSPALASNIGVIKVKSAFPIGETIERLKKDRPTKASSPSARSTNQAGSGCGHHAPTIGIADPREFDQAQLAANAGNKLLSSVLFEIAPRRYCIGEGYRINRDSAFHRRLLCR